MSISWTRWRGTTTGIDSGENITVSFKKALALDSTNVENYLNLATTHYYKQEYTEAEEMVRYALKLDAVSAEAYNILGMIYSKQNHSNEAMEAYNEGLKFESNNAYILNNRGFIKSLSLGIGFANWIGFRFAALLAAPF